MSSTTNPLSYTARDIVGYGPHPPHPHWPNDAKIAISFVLNYEEGSEVTGDVDGIAESIATELGPGYEPIRGGARDVNVESLYEYGSRAGVWRILRLFKEHDIRITAYAVGLALEKNPQVSTTLEADGHEIASHGYRWVDRSTWSEAEEEAYVRKAIHAIKATSPSGRPPRGWYYGMVATKAGERSRGLVAKVFKEEGIPLLYYSDDYGDDLPYWVPYPGGTKEEGLLIVPYALDTNDYKNSGHAAFVSPEDFTAYLTGAFDELYREGLKGAPKMLSIGLHCRIIGRPGRLAGLRKFIEYVKDKDGVWFATREEIAKAWRDAYPYASHA